MKEILRAIKDNDIWIVPVFSIVLAFIAVSNNITTSDIRATQYESPCISRECCKAEGEAAVCKVAGDHPRRCLDGDHHGANCCGAPHCDPKKGRCGVHCHGKDCTGRSDHATPKTAEVTCTKKKTRVPAH